jgi:phosphoribosyl 1,2-cyclic phosphate phosphodiesterase
MRLTLLGTGTSFGIPQIGCRCVVCRSPDPRDRRGRTSALVESGETRILIDTPPELRLQLVREGVDRVDAVLYTHEHADHVNGIDDLRMFSLRKKAPLPVHGPQAVLDYARAAFRYIFDDAMPVPAGTSRPRLTLHRLEAFQATTISGLPVLPIGLDHGGTGVFGYRLGPIGYATDVKRIPPRAREALRGVRVLVLSALWWRPHPTHQSIQEAVEAALDIGAERTYLTHLSHETSHQALLDRLPAGIEPGFDGLTVEVQE